jgi:hypothetical protein
LSTAIVSTTFTLPANYTLWATGTASTSQSAAAFYRILPAGATASSTTFTSARVAAHSLIFRGVDQANPFIGTPNVTNITTNGTTATTTAIAGGGVGDMAVAFFQNVLAATGGPQTVTTPTGYTLAAAGTNPVIQGATNVRQATSAAFYKADPGASEQPAATLGLSANHRNFLAVLRQAGGATPGRVRTMSKRR